MKRFSCKYIRAFAPCAGILLTLSIAGNCQAVVDADLVDNVWAEHLVWRTGTTTNTIAIEILCRDALKAEPRESAAVRKLLAVYAAKGEALLALGAARYGALLQPMDRIWTESLAPLRERIMALPPAVDQTTRKEVNEALRQFMRRQAESDERNLTEVEINLRSALLKAPRDHELISHLGSVYVSSSEWPMCAVLFAAAHDLYPRDPDIANNYALALDQAGLTSHAVSILEDQLKLNTEEPFLFANTTRLLLKEGREQEAVALAERWAETEPANPNVWLLLARHHLEQGKLEEAQKAAMEALNTNQASPDPYYLLAVIAMRGKDYGEARRWLRNASGVMTPAAFEDMLESDAFEFLPGKERIRK